MKAVYIHSMPLKKQLRVLKLNDEFGHYLLHISCLSCDNKRICEPADIAMRVGWQCTLDNLSRWFRCSRCGAKGARVEVGEAVSVRQPKWH